MPSRGNRIIGKAYLHPLRVDQILVRRRVRLTIRLRGLRGRDRLERHAVAARVQGAIEDASVQVAHHGRLQRVVAGDGPESLIAADHPVVPESVDVVGATVGRAEDRRCDLAAVGGSDVPPGTEEGPWCLDAAVAVEGVEERVAVGVLGARRIDVGNSGAALEEVTVVEAFLVAVRVDCVALLSDELQTAFAVVCVAEEIRVQRIVIRRTQRRSGDDSVADFAK